MSTRTQGILDRVSSEKFSGVRWILGDGVITNYMQSFVDDTMKRNAEFQSKAGVSPKIVRKSPTKCCPWCDALVGEYKYPDDVPDEIYHRHDNCNCIVEFYPGDGKKQNVWSKEWQEADADTIRKRKTAGLDNTTAAQLEERKTIGLDEPNNLRDGLGAEYYDEMQRMVDGSTDETAKAVWEQVNPKIGVADTKSRGREHQSFGRIYVNVKKNATGDMVYKPYEPIFHESGHAIDWIRSSDGSGAGSFLSTTYKNGIFRDTIIEEANDIVNKKAKIVKELFAKKDWDALNDIGAITDYELKRFKEDGKWLFGEPKYSKSKAYDAVSKDLKSMGTYKGGDVSDIMEGATNARAQGTMGHGGRYWKRSEQLLPTEAFAEFTSATFSNPESLEALKEWFPKSYKIWHEMLDEIIASGV